MRNLQLNHSLHIHDACELSGTQAITIDYDTKAVYCATATNVYGLDTGNQQVTEQVSLVEAGYMPGDGSGSIVGVQHLPDQMSVCIATAKGDVLLWNTTTNQMECVGSVDSGLTSMSWSPDQEVVVLTTGQDTLIMMTRDFDPVTEVPLHPEQFGEAEFVTLGWGKKETQFHGSEGKQAAIRKAEPVTPAFSWDDRRTRVSWRGDGQLFAVSSVAPETGARRVRVWTRDCALHSTSQSLDGAEQGLAWKPSGSLIASSQRKPNKHDVIFYENNGLQHGEFTLPFGPKEVQVRELLWNSESTVLAVWLEDMPPSDQEDNWVPKSYVQLWTVGNYHWYLKQHLVLPAERARRLTAVVWDPEFAYRLHLVDCGGYYMQYTWSWTTSRSPGSKSEDLSTVAVIDGASVLMTPFRHTVVPPPMSAYQIKAPAPVNEVVMGPPSCPNHVALVLCDGRIAVYEPDGPGDDGPGGDNSVERAAAGGQPFSPTCTLPRLQGVYRLQGDALPEQTYPLQFYHVTWLRDDVIVVCSQNAMGSGSVLHVARVDMASDSVCVRVKQVPIGRRVSRSPAGCCYSGGHEVEGHVFQLTVDVTGNVAAVQLTDGSLLRYDVDSDSLSPWVKDNGMEVRFPQPCTRMAVTSFGGQEAVLGLTERCRLYVNDVEVASNCTSFGIHEEFVLLTTHAHTCRCICRQTSLQALPALADGKAHPFDESVRRVERGSRIVTVVPDDTKVVLQMPRGNLETIHPRALVLSAVRKNLDRIQFAEAFSLMRRHRINMNLLYDHNPQVFLDNVDSFVTQIETASHINLILTDLQEEDVTVTMYTAAYSARTALPTGHQGGRQGGRPGVPSKVDAVCDAVRDALCRLDPDKYLLSILTTYVKKTNQDLETALVKIQDLKASQRAGLVSAEEALRYLLFLVDVNQLYDVALGSYDFDLVIMVAEKSQKDPREYLPFLNQLRRLTGPYQRYGIDRHLKRYSKALTHISQCCPERLPECMALIKEHALYPQAMELFPAGSQEFTDVAAAYGNHLTEGGHHEDAGLVYARAASWTLATAAFERSLNWKMALSMSTREQHVSEVDKDLCRRLADALKEQRRHAEAAVIMEDYMSDYEEAIVTLIEGHDWEESLRLMHKYRRLDFIETDLKTSLLESQGQLVALMAGAQADLGRYKARLAAVREEKERVRLELLEGGGDLNAADADLFSDTSSATGDSVLSGRAASRLTSLGSHSTAGSKTSGRSSRNRRKAERKKYSLKEGSRHEDFALIEALSKIYKQADEWKGEVPALLKMLTLFHYTQQARDLQRQMSDLLAVLESSITDIWLPDTGEDSQTLAAHVLGPDSTANAIAQAMQRGQRVRTDVELDPALRAPPTMNKDSKWKLLLAESNT